MYYHIRYRCASDADCAGLPWDPVVGGVCGADGRCVCPLPRSGAACQRELSCRWLDDEGGANTWRDGGCALHAEESSATQVACACTRLRASVTVLHELHLRPRCSSGASLVSCALPTADLRDLASLSFNNELAVLLAAVVAVNAVWLVLVIASKLGQKDATVAEKKAAQRDRRRRTCVRLSRSLCAALCGGSGL